MPYDCVFWVTSTISPETLLRPRSFCLTLSLPGPFTFSLDFLFWILSGALNCGAQIK